MSFNYDLIKHQWDPVENDIHFLMIHIKISTLLENGDVKRAISLVKNTLSFRKFSHLPMKAFNGIRRINEFTNLARILKIMSEIFPVFMPGF